MDRQKIYRRYLDQHVKDIQHIEYDILQPQDMIEPTLILCAQYEKYKPIPYNKIDIFLLVCFDTINVYFNQNEQYTNISFCENHFLDKTTDYKKEFMDWQAELILNPYFNILEIANWLNVRSGLNSGLQIGVVNNSGTNTGTKGGDE